MSALSAVGVPVRIRFTHSSCAIDRTCTPFTTAVSDPNRSKKAVTLGRLACVRTKISPMRVGSPSVTSTRVDPRGFASRTQVVSHPP
jgi:hypothetical protein